MSENHIPDLLDLAMLVDDDLFMLELMADMLAQLGVKQIEKISDARSALLQLQRQQPQLLICDLCMPDTDGIEFLEKVAINGFQGWVMLYSGVAPGVIRAAERLAHARGLKILGAFSKPLKCADLQAILERFFTLGPK